MRVDAGHSDILIVGAGASGLMAARELSRAGKSVVVLEACDRIGGRIYPLDERVFGYEAQGGAEFVHGAAPVTKALIREAGLTLTYPIEWWNVLDGEPRKGQLTSPHHPLLNQKLKELEDDIPVAEFLATRFGGGEFATFRESVLRRVEGYDAADPKRASSLALLGELTEESGWMQMNIKEGYGTLIRYLERECRAHGAQIHLGKEVVAVELSGNTVQVRTAEGALYDAGRAIVTVPLPLLQEITFKPQLPEKMEAAGKIGFGPVIKILIRFKSKWWTGARQKNFEKLFFMFSREVIPTWWTQYPEPHTTLTGWVAGPSAQALSARSEGDLLDLALVSLSNIFKISVAELRGEIVASEVVNWPAEQYARGGYSYSTPESGEAVKELAQPVGDRLYFCGEAIREESSTVESAFASGKEVAEAIIASS